MISKDGEVVIAVRDRGLSIPTWDEIDAIQSAEDRLRYQILYKLGWALYGAWARFANKHFSGMPDHTSGEVLPWPEFIGAYSVFLRRFKAARKSDDLITRYFCSIRISLYDEVFQVWKDLARLCREIDAADFYDRFGQLAFQVGGACRELDLVATDKMNAPEHLIQHRENLQRAASVRHAENRAMKAEVFSWLDSNMARFTSKDGAAAAIAGKVAPIKFRAARDWVGEWARLRSPRRL